MKRIVIYYAAWAIVCFVMYFVQMAVPATELGWLPDIAILVGVTVLITLYGMAPRSVA